MHIMYLILLGLCCVSLSLQQNIKDTNWVSFRLKHGKHYHNSTEELSRFKLWLARAKAIRQHNSRPDATYKQGHHFHADFFEHELENLRGLKVPKNIRDQVENAPSVDVSLAAIPSSLDWREKGYVTPVKDQGQCGSCWSFSAVGALEGQYFKKSGKLVDMSEQQFVDCVKTRSTRGCNGGWMNDVFDYAKVGINSEATYPYVSGTTERVGSCSFKSNKIVTKTAAKAAFSLVKGSEANILKAVANIGPLAITVCANDNFMNYESGVFTDSPCDNKSPNNQMNHAIVITGYDDSYWIGKNSWGPKWGEAGYIKIARNKSLIGNAMYPIL